MMLRRLFAWRPRFIRDLHSRMDYAVASFAAWEVNCSDMSRELKQLQKDFNELKRITDIASKDIQAFCREYHEFCENTGKHFRAYRHYHNNLAREVVELKNNLGYPKLINKATPTDEN